jgi:hypothetical protein
LRREEVASLAGVSVHYFVKLVQGRAANASGQVVEAVARALRLDGVERRGRGRRAAQLGRAACDHVDARHGRGPDVGRDHVKSGASTGLFEYDSADSVIFVL